MASTPLLGLSLPADGTTNWGTLVNTSITALLDSAVAGTTTLSTDADVTLSATTEAANQARQAIILWNATGTVTRNITAPAQSKTYVVINATGGTQSIVLRGTGPTTGVTIPAGKAYMLVWKGNDFVTTGATTVDLATDVTGVLPFANGGTSQSNRQAAINALVGTQTANRVLRSDGTNSTLSQVALATDVTGTLPIANGGTNSTGIPTAGGVAYGTGTAYAVTVAGTSGQVLTSNGAAAPTWAAPASTGVSSISFASTGLTPNTATTGAVTVAGTLNVASGGTGLASGTSGGVLYYSNTNALASSTLLASNALMVGGGAGAAPATVTTGTGVVTALGVNTGSAGAFVVNGGALGTPASGTVTNLTGTASININGSVGATTPDTGTFTRLRTGVAAISSSATITPTSDAVNQYNVIALATPATIAAPSGTPVDGQKLLIRIKDDGTARALTWNSIYRPIGTSLPATTVAGKVTYIGCIYNSGDTFNIKWDVVAVTTQA
jgi:hypothetical protein